LQSIHLMKMRIFLAFVTLSLFGVSTVISHDKIVGCYWGTWSFYRPGYGQFRLENLDASLCTHGYYGFADLHNDTWTIKIWDPWLDQAPEDCEPGYCNYDNYRNFIKLKDTNPNFVPMISIGGWNAGSGAYSTMAADPEKRKTFIDSVSEFLDTYPFDGVDLDWEYPGKREGSDPEHDKENFSILVAELGAMLKARGLLFTGAFSPAKYTAEDGYDFAAILPHFDFLNVMTYDYHGWFPDHFFTGHNAPLYRREEEDYEGHPGWYFNVWDTLSVYLENGVPKEKIVMGIPLYGRGFVLNDTEQNGLYCGAHAGIPAGPYTRQKGIWGYQEIMQAKNNDTLINLPDANPHDWTEVVDDCYHAPYIYNGPYWIGHDDEASCILKGKFINFMDFAGAFVWSIDTDEFRGDYGKKFPLLHAIHEGLESGETFDPENPHCKGTAPMCDLFETTTAPPTTTPNPGPNECTEDLDVIPYPGDCHKYYMCLAKENGDGYDLKEFTCGDWVFDPNTDACTDPNLPSNDLLCPGF